MLEYFFPLFHYTMLIRFNAIMQLLYFLLFLPPEINVTIPQFDGTSLVSLTRSTQSHTNQQKLAPAFLRPDHIGLNFTTAELNGLLLWIAMVNLDLKDK